MLANGVWSASCLAQARLGEADFSPVPDRQRLTAALYQAADGRWMQLNMVRTAEVFDLMLVAMDAVHLLADERFATLEDRALHAEELTAIMRELFAARTSEEWLQLLAVDHGLPVERVATFDDPPTDEHLTLNGIVSPAMHDVGMAQVINDPVNVEGVTKKPAGHAPTMGQHSDEVLRELGYDEATIARLRADGII